MPARARAQGHSQDADRFSSEGGRAWRDAYTTMFSWELEQAVERMLDGRQLVLLKSVATLAFKG